MRDLSLEEFYEDRYEHTSTMLYRNEYGIYLTNKDVFNTGLSLTYTVDGREYVELNGVKYWGIDDFMVRLEKEKK